MGIGPSRNISRVSLAVLWLVVALWPISAPALDPSKALTQYILDRWEAEDGLPQNSVMGIAQTPEGYLWLATQEGIARFDGVNFTVFNRENTPAIGNNNIRCLMASRNGTLWIGTNGGGLVSMRSGEFKAYTKRDGLAGDIVISLCQDRRGDIWIGTFGSGLSRLSDGVITNYGKVDGLCDDIVYSLCPANDGSLWIGTSAGLCHLHDGRFTSMTTADGLPKDVIYSILEDSRGRLWAGTFGGGLCFIDQGKLHLLNAAQGLTNDYVCAVMEDREGTIWIGTADGGLNRLRDGMLSSLGKGDRLADASLRILYEDSEGSLWIGLDGGGLFRLKDGKFTVFSAQEGLTNDIITGILPSRDNGLWIGTYGGGLNHLRDGKVKAYGEKDGLCSNLIWSLTEAHDGSLWVGTDGGGLCRIANGKIRHFGRKDGLTSDIVPALLEDRQGRLWVGTTGGGVLRYEAGRFEDISSPQNLATQTVHMLYEDREGTIWAGTNQGLGRLEGDHFRIIGKEDGLSSEVVSAILESPRGGYWIGTIGGGLNLMRDGKVTNITRKDGLFDDVIYAIMDDGQGNLWMSCNRGVFFAKERDLFDFATGRSTSVSCESFGRSDGMKSGECNGGFTPAACMLPDGTLCFPTIRGVAEIDSSRVNIRSKPPPVLVERAIYNRTYRVAPKSLILAPGSPQLEIHYTALSFLSPDKVLFRYRLEGFDKEWIDAGTRRVAYYTNLPPGSYTFHVIACNSEGVWNKTGAAISIEQQPHVYQRPLFYVLVALGLFLIGAFSYHLRVRSMRARQKRLQRVVEERTRDLQEANRSLELRSLELERLNLELEQISALDGLTGVANRRRFDERLDAEWRRARRTYSFLSLVLLDVDYFKAFNDSYGHQKGDLCLKRVACFLVDSFSRAGDLVARLGGDEFCIILPDTNREEAMAQAEKLRTGLEALAIPHEHSPASSSVTASVGVASCQALDKLEAEDLMSAADHALYAAKNAGRNKVRFRETMRSPSSHRSEQAK